MSSQTRRGTRAGERRGRGFALSARVGLVCVALGLAVSAGWAQLVREPVGGAPPAARETAVQPIRPAIIHTEEKKQLDYADSLFEQGDFERALREYAEFLARFPESASREAAERRRAVALAELDRNEEALAAFREYVRAFPGSDKRVEAETQIGLLLMKKGETAAAAQALYEVVRREGIAGPALEPALYYLGQANYQRSRWSECAGQMRQYLEKFPKGHYAPQARFYLAECLRRQDRGRDALPHFRQLLELARDPRAELYSDLIRKAHYSLADTLYDLGQYAEAGKTFSELAAAYPDWPHAEQAAYQAVWAASAENHQERTLAAAQRFMQSYPNSYLRFSVMSLLAGAQFDQKQYDAAAETYRAILAGSTDTAQRLAAEVRLLWCDFESGRHAELEKRAAALVERAGSATEAGAALLLWGSSLYQRGQYAAALERFQQVTRRFPDGPDAPAAAYYGSLSLYAERRYAEAARAFEEFATRFAEHPDAPSALWLAGESHRLAGNPTAALDRLGTLLAKYPGFDRKDDALYSLFGAQRALSRTAEMVVSGEKILAGSHDHERAAEVYYSIANAYREEDNYAKVVEYAGKALALPASAYHNDARYLLALALSQQGKFDESVAELTALLLARPPYPVQVQWHAWAARYLDQKKDWKQSRVLWERLLARSEAGEFRAEALLRIGQASLRLGENATARRQLLEFLRAYPDTVEAAEAQLEIARSHAAEEKWKEAIEFYEKSKAANLYSDANDQVLLGIQAAVEGAEAKLELGEHAEAYRDLDRIVLLFETRDDYRPRALYRLGEALEKIGRAEVGRQRYAQVVEAFPDSSWAEKAKARLNAP